MRVYKKELEFWNQFGKDYLTVNIDIVHRFLSKPLEFRQRKIIRAMKNLGYTLTKNK